MRKEIDRRAFLGAGAAGLGALSFGASAAASAERVRRTALPLARDVAFKQGVAAGQPSTKGITLWTRLEGAERSSRLALEVASDSGFRHVVHRREVTSQSGRDFTARARVSSGLKPGEQYYYRFATCDESSPVGRFRTARPADSREPVRIGFFSCQDFVVGYYTAHQGLAAEPDLDLVVCLGDYIYEKAFFNDPVRKDDSASDGETQTLAEYRSKYSLYHTDANLLALRRNCALVAVWDDHEVEDNYADGKPGGATDHRRVPFEQRKANGYRAWNEHLPRMPTNTIYGREPMGANMELIRLDQRQYRDDQPCSPMDSFVAPGCPESVRNDPKRTMLGAPQKQFLKDALAASTATWKIVTSELMMMALDFPARQPLNTDGWDGYGGERRELIEFIRDRGIKNVSFITGDIHTFFAGEVTPSGREGVPAIDGDPVATEFVGSAITSSGVADQLGEPPAQPVALPTDAGVLANNPHIKFSNQAFKGYGVLEARPDELLVEYRAARTIKQPKSEVFTLQGFRVAAGDPHVQVAGAVLGRKPPRPPQASAAAAPPKARLRACESSATRRSAGKGGSKGGGASAGSPSGGTTSANAAATGSLPFTGLDVRPLGAAGAVMLGVGALIRRRIAEAERRAAPPG